MLEAAKFELPISVVVLTQDQVNLPAEFVVETHGLLSKTNSRGP